MCDYLVTSGAAREEAVVVCAPEQRAGRTGDAVSLQPAGPADQGPGEVARSSVWHLAGYAHRPVPHMF